MSLGRRRSLHWPLRSRERDSLRLWNGRMRLVRNCDALTREASRMITRRITRRRSLRWNVSSPKMAVSRPARSLSVLRNGEAPI